MMRNLLCMMALVGSFLLPLAPPAEAARGGSRPAVLHSSPLYAPLLLPIYAPLLLIPPIPTHR